MGDGMVFVEFRGFSKRREDYLNDEAFRALQNTLFEAPKAGDVIKGTGGIRKLRFAAKGKGKRGGVRVIYYHETKAILLLLLIYGKNQQDDLTVEQKKLLTKLVEQEIEARHG
jgi:mRNA-degrading endonuclease RelE of RelBE toxin-antitoxin system